MIQFRGEYIQSQSLKKFGIIDEILPEPNGGAHSDFEAAAASLRKAVIKHLSQLSNIKPEELINQRVEKYSAMGVYSE